MHSTPAPPLKSQVTAVILSGGRGQRMAGEDKGWIELNNEAFIEHALERLRQTHLPRTAWSESRAPRLSSPSCPSTASWAT